MSNNNVTYFLGAGASANAIPVVENFNIELKNFCEKLYDSYFQYLFKDKEMPYTLEQRFELLINRKWNTLKEINVKLCSFALQFDSLLNDLNHHNTIDTLAKRFYLSEGVFCQKLVCLKALLNIFFLDIQFNNNKLDRRYDTLIATMLQSKNDRLAMPPNINFVTWNYDLQFEIALKKYSNKKFIDIQHKYQISPSVSYDNPTNVNSSKFSMIKLNGTAGIFDVTNSNEHSLQNIDDLLPDIISSEELIDLFLELYNNKKRTCLNFFRYSWETYNINRFISCDLREESTNQAMKIFSNTKTLVVIGYSFPDFNRDVDLKLFRSLPAYSTIYIQDTNPRVIKNVENIFPFLKDKFIVVNYIDDVNLFHIPNAYYQ